MANPAGCGKGHGTTKYSIHCAMYPTIDHCFGSCAAIASGVRCQGVTPRRLRPSRGPKTCMNLKVVIFVDGTADTDSSSCKHAASFRNSETLRTSGARKAFSPCMADQAPQTCSLYCECSLPLVQVSKIPPKKTFSILLLGTMTNHYHIGPS